MDGAVLAWTIDRERKHFLAVQDQVVNHLGAQALPVGQVSVFSRRVPRLPLRRPR